MKAGKIYLMSAMVVLAISACSGKKTTEDPNGIEPVTTLAISDEGGDEDKVVESYELEDGTLSDEDFKESLAAMSETLGEDYSVAALENEDGEIDYKFVPTRFMVYEDGESHYLMYGANELLYMYGDFTNIAYPEYHIAAISFPTSLVNPDYGTKVLGKTDELSVNDMEEGILYDTSALYSTENVSVFSIEDKTCLFRTWSMPYDGDPATLNKEIISSLYTQENKMYNLLDEEWQADQLEDGSYRYSTVCFLRDYVDDSINSLAIYMTIVKDGRAYCYLAGSYNPENAYWLDTYILKHSFTFQ